jgi:DNA-binding transcriptional ArsR family regulator
MIRTDRGKMRPLFHPSIDAVTVEAILHALSDPVRVAIFSDIAASQCSQTCSSFLQVSEKTIPKSTLSQHFKALREAGLIRSERRGVEMHNISRCAEIDHRFPGLIAAIVKAHKIEAEGNNAVEAASSVDGEGYSPSRRRTNATTLSRPRQTRHSPEPRGSKSAKIKKKSDR